MALILLDKGQNEVVVESDGTLGSRVEHPDEHAYLDNVVEGDEVQEDPCELVQDGEKTEHNPVGQPQFIIVSSF